jgi:hypothetical protein
MRMQAPPRGQARRTASFAMDGLERTREPRLTPQVRRNKMPAGIGRRAHFASLEFAQYNLSRNHLPENTFRTLAILLGTKEVLFRCSAKRATDDVDGVNRSVYFTSEISDPSA